MSPTDASVYSDTLSPLTWVLILTAIIVVVVTLLVSFIALVHRSIEQSVRTTAPAEPNRVVPAPGRQVDPVTGAAAPLGAARPDRPSHAA